MAALMCAELTILLAAMTTRLSHGLPGHEGLGAGNRRSVLPGPDSSAADIRPRVPGATPARQAGNWAWALWDSGSADTTEGRNKPAPGMESKLFWDKQADKLEKLSRDYVSAIFYRLVHIKLIFKQTA